MKYYGKYRGTVDDNLDPKKQGRLKIIVPTISGDDPLGWAMPCVPYAGKKVGLFLLPPKNANVWVEFENGNVDFPIWSGCFWGNNELPPDAANADIKLLQTEGITLKLSDKKNEGGITLEAKSPALSKPLTVILDKKGIAITNEKAKIELTPNGINISFGSQAIQISTKSVSVNKGNLEVM